MTKKLKGLWGKFLCSIDNHSWTCAGLEGIKPTQVQLDAKPVVDGFWDYAKTYCKRCHVLSPLSRRGLGTR